MSETGLLGLDVCRVWDTDLAFRHLNDIGEAETKRTAERRLHELGILPTELGADTLQDEHARRPIRAVLDWQLAEARSKRKLVLFAQLFGLPGGHNCLHVTDSRGARYLVTFGNIDPDPNEITNALRKLKKHICKNIANLPQAKPPAT